MITLAHLTAWLGVSMLVRAAVVPPYTYGLSVVGAVLLCSGVVAAVALSFLRSYGDDARRDDARVLTCEHCGQAHYARDIIWLDHKMTCPSCRPLMKTADWRGGWR